MLFYKTGRREGGAYSGGALVLHLVDTDRRGAYPKGALFRGFTVLFRQYDILCQKKQFS